MVRKRRIYTHEFKLEVLRLIENGGRISEVARDMNLSPSVVHGWMRQSKAVNDVQQDEDSSNPASREDILRLRKRVRELELERDILKKATVWFAKHVP